MTAAVRTRGDTPIAGRFDAAASALERGFTLIELLVTLTVSIIMLAIAIPSMRDFTLRNQLASARSALLASLAYARTEAARRGSSVYVVAASGAPTGNEFGNGWDIYANRDADGLFGTAGAPSLRHYNALPTALVVHGNTQVTFDASGYLTPPAAASFKVCQAVAGTEGFLVTVPPSGTADVSTFDVASASDCNV